MTEMKRECVLTMDEMAITPGESNLLLIHFSD